MKRAQEEITDLVSWARNLPEKRASGPAIALDESFRERGLGKVLKGLKGSIDETNKEAKDLLAFVRSRYHFKALTEHHTSSSSTEEKDEKGGKKISTD